MDKCYNTGDFGRYFRENMDAMGLPAPMSLFGTFTTAVSNGSMMAGVLHQLGPSATMRELAKATLKSEKFALVLGLSAAWYTGAAVGSIAVASGRSLGCGTRLSDIFVFVHRHQLRFPGWETFYHRHPQVIDVNHPHRRNVGLIAGRAA